MTGVALHDLSHFLRTISQTDLTKPNTKNIPAPEQAPPWSITLISSSVILLVLLIGVASWLLLERHKIKKQINQSSTKDLITSNSSTMMAEFEFGETIRTIKQRLGYYGLLSIFLPITCVGVLASFWALADDYGNNIFGGMILKGKLPQAITILSLIIRTGSVPQTATTISMVSSIALEGSTFALLDIPILLLGRSGNGNIWSLLHALFVRSFGLHGKRSAPY